MFYFNSKFYLVLSYYDNKRQVWLTLYKKDGPIVKFEYIRYVSPPLATIDSPKCW